MTAHLQSVDQSIAVDALDRVFTGNIDRRHQHHVGVVEGTLKFFHMIAQTGEAMRLDDSDHAALRAFACSRQHGLDFDRMVAIVIDDGDTVNFTDLGKAPLDAAKVIKALGDLLVGHAHFKADGHRSNRVLDIMAARHRQCDILDGSRFAITVAHDHVKAVATGDRGDIDTLDVGLSGKTISNDPPVADAGQHRLHFGMVDAQDRGAVKGYILDKLDETVLDLVEAAIMIEMLGIDIGNDRDRAVEPQKAAVAFVGFDDHPLAGTKPCVGTILVDDAAVDHGRIDTARIQHRRNHRSGRGLAVGSGDRNGRF